MSQLDDILDGYMALMYREEKKREIKALMLEQLHKVNGMNSVNATLAIIAKRIEDL